MPTPSLLPDQAVWAGLTALALEFIAVGRALRDELTFRFLGISLGILCLMIGCDIWIVLPGLGAPWGTEPLLDAFQLAFQALACAFVHANLGFLRRSMDRPSGRTYRAHSAILVGWVLVSLADLAAPAILFIGLDGGIWRTTPLYDFGFMPYLIGTMSWITWTAIRLRSHAGPADARMLGRLGGAYGILLLGGILDFAGIVGAELVPYASFTLVGTLGFAMGCCLILTDRLVGLFVERRKMLLEMARVHGELGADDALREIGRSAAQVGHALRANVDELRAKVEVLKEAPAGGHGSEVARIERARGSLERLAAGILEFSRGGIIAERKPVDPARFLAEFVAARPPDQAARIRVKVEASPLPIHVDAARMRRCCEELVKNSFEAGAGRVEIRLLQGLGRTVIVLEDDGHGLAQGSVAEIAKPFFTTRKGEGGIGLGAAIAAAALRGHGGSLRYYRRPRGGLCANLVLPTNPLQPMGGDTPACALVTSDAGRVEEFLAACENLGVQPILPGPARAAARMPAPTLVDGAPGASAILSEETLLLVLLEGQR